MNANRKRTALVALIAGLAVGIPTTARINTQAEQIEIEQANSDLLEDKIRVRDNNLGWSRISQQLTADEIKRKVDEVHQLREHNDRLQRETRELKAKQAASVKRQAVKQASVPAARRVAASGNCEAYRGLVAAHFPAGQVNNALLTMRKESGCRPGAVSPAGDHGLMQINARYHAWRVGGNVRALYDPATNIRVAAQIYRESGWRPWVAVRGILY